MQSEQYTDRALNLLTIAQKLAQDRQHSQLTPIHLLAAFVETQPDGSKSYVENILSSGRFNYDEFKDAVNRKFNTIPSQQPAPAEIQPSHTLIQVLKDAGDIQKQQKDSFIAQDHIFLALLKSPPVKDLFKQCNIDTEAVKTQALQLRGNTKIDSRSADTSDKLEYLSKYAIDMTEDARLGKMDPVIGRNEEAKAVIRVLARRTKSNCILTGPGGVGKTAIVELISQKITDGDVPNILKNAKLFALDLALLNAGAKYKGDFEERLKGVIKEVEENSKEGHLIILFIDEIHMLMGNGSDDTQNAANILKPALSRQAIKVIGATTDNEYRAIFEKDAAAARRFQVIHVNEPSIKETLAILRGLKDKYEIHHGVRILDSGIVSCATMAKRYLPYRLLPDSAIDLLDISSAKVAIDRESKPEELDTLERAQQMLEIEIKALERDAASDPTTKERLEQAKKREAELMEEIIPIRNKFEAERSSHMELKQAKMKMDELLNKAADAERRHDTQTAADLRYFAIPDLREKIQSLEDKVAEEEATNADDSLVKNVVDSAVVAEICAKLTGVPVSKISEDENDKLVNMEAVLSEEVVGQKAAIKSISNAVRLTRSGLADKRQPASFLFLGQSGTGKTELSKALSRLLFKGEDDMIRIDCSELSEKHTIAKLIGAPAGYVGYNDKYMLADLKTKPYSVLLFDEVEKAHPDVLNILLQMLDEGKVTASDGSLINCSNCIVILTSNLGAGYIAEQSGSKITPETREKVMDAVKAHFRPELINRISSIVIFNKLSHKAINKIIDIRMKELERRFEENDKYFKLVLSPEAKQFLCDNGYSSVYGARPLNRLIKDQILNQMAIKVLRQQILPKEAVEINLNAAGDGLEVVSNHVGLSGYNDDDDDAMEVDSDEDFSDDNADENEMD